MVGESRSPLFGSIALAIVLVSGSPGEEGFVSLFDGHSLAGWTSIGGKPGNWGVQGGRLVTRGIGKDWISTNRSFSDFVLRLEYRTGPGGNSGVLIRAPHKGEPSFNGMEIQILDDEALIYRDLKPDQYTGSIYGVVAAKRGQVRPPGEWNALEIQCERSRIRVELNGVAVVDERDVASHAEALARHPGIGRRSGFLGFQSHESPVQFRNIRIRELR